LLNTKCKVRPWRQQFLILPYRGDRLSGRCLRYNTPDYMETMASLPQLTQRWHPSSHILMLLADHPPTHLIFDLAHPSSPDPQGGLTWLWLDSPYVIAARKLFNWAVQANEAGNPFPVGVWRRSWQPAGHASTGQERPCLYGQQAAGCQLNARACSERCRRGFRVSAEAGASYPAFSMEQSHTEPADSDSKPALAHLTH
jgi:hypothetical protein